jgi:hypothetical protein
MVPHTSAALSGRLRKSDGSSSGSATRRSHHTNARSAPAPDGERLQYPGVAPALVACADHAEHEREQRHGDHDAPDAVDPSPLGSTGLGREQPHPEPPQCRDDGRRPVARAPAERLDHDACQERSGGDADGRQAQEQAEGSGSLLGGEQAHDERQRKGSDGRVAQAVQAAGERELSGGGGDRGQQRGDDDEAGTDHEHTPPTASVAQHAAEEHEGPEEQLAQRHHDLHARRRGAKRGAGVLQRQ